MTQSALTQQEKVEGAFGSRFFMRGEGFGMGVAVVEGSTRRRGSARSGAMAGAVPRVAGFGSIRGSGSTAS